MTGYTCSSADLWNQTPGTAVHQQARLGDVSAVLTGTAASDGVEPTALAGGLLTISVGGHSVLSASITPPANTKVVDLYVVGTDTTPAGTAQNAGSLCVVRFTPTSAPVALLALTTGGAHCCTTLRAFATTGSASTADRAFGNYGATLRQTSAGPVIAGGDDAFAYTFAPFASSEPPIQLFTVNAGAYVNVTRDHPELVRADQAAHLASYQATDNAAPLGALAGWVADSCLVDPTRQALSAWAFVDQQNGAGKLTGPSGWPTGSAYVAALHSLLAAQGYCVAPPAATPSH